MVKFSFKTIDKYKKEILRVQQLLRDNDEYLNKSINEYLNSLIREFEMFKEKQRDKEEIKQLLKEIRESKPRFKTIDKYNQEILRVQQILKDNREYSNESLNEYLNILKYESSYFKSKTQQREEIHDLINEFNQRWGTTK